MEPSATRIGSGHGRSRRLQQFGRCKIAKRSCPEARGRCRFGTIPELLQTQIYRVAYRLLSTDRAIRTESPFLFLRYSGAHRSAVFNAPVSRDCLQVDP